MNKSELIKHISERTAAPQVLTGKIVDAAIVAIKQQVLAGETVQLMGFATFTLKARPERQGRNPQTGEAMTIDATEKPHCKLGKW